MDRRDPSALALLLLGLLVSCTRYPDGKILCENVSECPGSEFRECRATASSGLRKLCFRAPESAGAGAGGTVAEAGAESPGERSMITGGAISQGGSGGPAPRDQAGAGAPAPSTPKPEAGSGGSSTRAGSDAAGGGAGSSATGFRVTGSEPADGTVLNDVNAPLVVHFSEPIDTGSVTDVTFIILANGQRVTTGERKTEDTQVTFRPMPRWVLSSDYEVVLSSSLFSKQQKPLPITHIKFRVHDGSWMAERVQTRASESDFFGDPQVVASATGEVGIAWDVGHPGSRHVGSHVMRRTADGFKELDAAPGGAAAPLTMLEDGTLIYGVQPDDPGQQATLTCVDPQLNKHALPLAGMLEHQTSTIEGVGVDYGQVEVLQHSGDSMSQYGQISTRCDQGATASLTPLPVAAGAVIHQISFAREGVAAWTQSTPAADSGMASSVWVLVRWAGSGCSQAAGCPQQLSHPDKVADSAVLAQSGFSSIVVVWRELEQSGASIWAARIGSSNETWQPVRLTAENVSAQAPTVALRGDDALAVWVQQQALERRVMGATFDAATEHWSAPQPLSETFVVPESSDEIAPVVAAGPGGMLVAWRQPSAQPGMNDIHVTSFTFGQPWPDPQRPLLSQTHLAGPGVSLAVDASGRGYAAWVEADAIWFGRYE